MSSLIYVSQIQPINSGKLLLSLSTLRKSVKVWHSRFFFCACAKIHIVLLHLTFYNFLKMLFFVLLV